jgi:outer membrane protein OmpA-like peptidoglycan-associated protein
MQAEQQQSQAPIAPKPAPKATGPAGQSGASAQGQSAEVLRAFTQATGGAGSAVPYQDEMESSFGASFGGVQAHLGQSGVQGAGANALTQDEVMAFGSGSPDRETVAHELTHVLQARNAGGGGSDRVSRAGEPAEREAEGLSRKAAAGQPVTVEEASKGIHGDWMDDALAGASDVLDSVGNAASDALDSVGNAVGDALDMRENEAQLDAEEDLAEFRAQTFADLTGHKTSTGIGRFNLAFNPANGRLLVTLKVKYDFVNGTPANVAPGFPAAEFAWTPDQETDWKTRYQTDVAAMWSSQHQFKSTKPFWDAMVVDTTVVVTEDAADPHFILTVSKYPDDAQMAGSSICPPGYHHDAGMCSANPADASGTRSAHGTGKFDSNDMRPEAKLDRNAPATAVSFAAGSARLDGAARAALAPVTTQLTAAPTNNVQLTGRSNNVHKAGVTPAQGAIDNMALARSRSTAVATQLQAGGIAADRVLVRNDGEQGADATPAWRRVDVQIATHQTQNPALHETGHMLGLGDEYTAVIDPKYQAMVTAAGGPVLAQARDESAMSMGSTVQSWHYSSFLEGLKAISGMTEWSL